MLKREAATTALRAPCSASVPLAPGAVGPDSLLIASGLLIKAAAHLGAPSSLRRSKLHSALIPGVPSAANSLPHKAGGHRQRPHVSTGPASSGSGWVQIAKLTGTLPHLSPGLESSAGPRPRSAACRRAEARCGTRAPRP